VATKWDTVDAYIAALPGDRRPGVEDLRKTIRDAAPDAIESIAYDMPAFRLNDKFLVSYAAFKNHYSLFPASAAVVAVLGDEIRPYVVGQATIRFPTNAPIPTDVVARVVRIRLEELAGRKSR
jgi:uncharacterized protein YdhG (YjbR/CyaY superfamily)